MNRKVSVIEDLDGKKIVFIIPTATLYMACLFSS